MGDELENLNSPNEENENADSSNGEEVDVDTLKQQLAEKEEQNKKLFERAKQAEALAKQLKTQSVKKEEPETPKSPELNLKDIRALQDVHDDDVDELLEYAKFKGVSVAEVKKLPVIQAHLKVKAEERTTAQATSIGKGGSRTSKITGQTLLEKAYETGETPQTPEEISALVKARIQEKLEKKWGKS